MSGISEVTDGRCRLSGTLAGGQAAATVVQTQAADAVPPPAIASGATPPAHPAPVQQLEA